MTRADGRSPSQLRPITFQTGFTRWAEGSVLVQFGNTHVLCNVTIENSLPPWLRGRAEPRGWLTAEYAMLPRSTHSRSQREQRWPKGRTQEISRLIGRSLRMALDLSLLAACRKKKDRTRIFRINTDLSTKTGKKSVFIRVYQCPNLFVLTSPTSC